MNKALITVCLAALIFPASFSQGQIRQGAQHQLLDDAVADLNKRKFDAALEKLREAEKLDPNSALILNLLGAVYAKKKDYQTAKSYFESSLSRDANFFPPAFNIGELLFLEKAYSQALDSFSKMLSADSANELLQFKIVLCLLLTGQAGEAQKRLARMKFPGNGPAWYYAQAALKLMEADKRSARELLASAQVIFPGKTSLYNEAFQDLDWPTQ